MKRIRITSAAVFPQEAVEAAVHALAAGEVVLLPTETVYGLAVDAQNPAAVEKLFATKGRASDKTVQIIFADIKMAERYANIPAEARRIAAAFLPGPLTLVVAKKAGAVALNANNEVGVRIPAHTFCLAVARAFGRPLSATSANRSGMLPERSVDAILAQLGDHAGIISVAIDEGELPERSATTVIELMSDRPPRVIREGALSSEEVLRGYGMRQP